MVNSSVVNEISNGICKFSPTSTKGKWIFLIQTVILSFTPIFLLIVQNSVGFAEMMKWKNDIILKDKLVTQATGLSKFLINLQNERAKVSLAVFLDARSGKPTDLTGEYDETDKSLQAIKWRTFGPEKIFQNKLRFQIRVDDFRERVSAVSRIALGGNTTTTELMVSDTEILEFYNLATSRLLTGRVTIMMLYFY